MDFSPLKTSSAPANKELRPHVGFRRDAWMRLKKNRAAMAGLGIIIFIGLLRVADDDFFALALIGCAGPN